MSRRPHQNAGHRTTVKGGRDFGRGRNDARAQVAQLAARLMAEGLTDICAAKQKAARQLGVVESHALPDNHEIEAALREHFALFCSEPQQRELQALRKTAIRAMLRFEQFSPWLVGAVLAGTANKFSEIDLEITGVEPKEFEMYLLNARIDFEMRDTNRRSFHTPAGKAREIIYEIEVDQKSVTISLYQDHLSRQAAHPRGSTRHERLQRAEAEKRFKDEEIAF